MLKRIKDRLFYYAVEKNAFIKYDYCQYVNNNLEKHKRLRLKSWLYLSHLNFKYRILRKEGKIYKFSKNSKKETHKPYLGAESGLSNRQPIQHFVKKLVNNYEIISFDIFDTLLLRPFQKPEDLFLVLAQKHGFLDFASIRHREEKKLRAMKEKQYGNREVTIEEIYEQVSKCTGIDKNYGIKIEFDLEKEFCFANPYMKEVFEILRYNNKKIIAVSDMYYPKKMMKDLLQKCGYDGIDDIFISCDYYCSKSSGKLYEVVDKEYTKGYKVCHIGDNYNSDVIKAKEFGWESMYYKSVHDIGYQYRPRQMSPIIGSIYSGIVNTYLHSSETTYSEQYEYGFIYGGLFILGYCNFINKYVKLNSIDKVLFLSRDGWIIKKVYDYLYPSEDTEYVFWSRIVGSILSSKVNRFDLINQYIILRSQSKNKLTALNILKSMDVEFLAEELSSYNLDSDDIIDEEKGVILSDFVLDNWDVIIESYESKLTAAKLYLDPIIKNSKKIAVVDIGWRGSGAIALKNVIEKIWKYNCEVIGLLGASAKLDETSNIAQIQDGTLVPYLMSQVHNVGHSFFHRKNILFNTFVELFVSAKHPSFKFFNLNKEKTDYELEFESSEVENYEIISEIHQGIFDFAKEYVRICKNNKFLFNISGSDAYIPIKHIIRFEKQYIQRYLGSFKFKRLITYHGKIKQSDSIRNIINERKI